MIDGYDLADPADRAFAFDYDGSGRLDHLVLYRPGKGTIWILKNNAGQFSPVFANSPTALVSNVAGTATLVTSSSDPRLSSPPSGSFTATLEFSFDRSTVRIVGSLTHRVGTHDLL